MKIRENTNFKIKEQDGMPREVATELLCTGALRFNRERKVATLARSTVFESTLRRKSLEEKLGNRLRRSSLSQLHRWHTRAEHRYIGIQHKFAKVEQAIEDCGKDEKLAKEARAYLSNRLNIERNRLMLVGTQIEIFLTQVEDVITKRQADPKRREALAHTIFSSMVGAAWHKMVGVELHWDPLTLFP